MKLLVITTNFGFGPVSKLLTVLEKILSYSNVSITFCGIGHARRYLYENLQNRIKYINFDTEQINSKQISKIMKNYDLLINVMELHVQKIAPIDVIKKSIFIDSLSWMWNAPIDNIENCMIYFVQKSINHLESNFYYVNSIEVNPIVDLHLDNSAILPQKFVLVNIAGTYTPKDNDDFGITYLKFWMSIINSIEEFESYEVIYACNDTQKEYFDSLFSSKKTNFTFKVFTHQGFLRAAKAAVRVFSTPGITFYFESISLGIDVFYLLPSNYSQSLLLEEYVKNGAQGLPFSLFGDKYRVAHDLAEAEGVKKTREIFRLITKENSSKIREKLYLELKNKHKSIKQNIYVNGADQICNELARRGLFK